MTVTAVEQQGRGVDASDVARDRESAGEGNEGARRGSGVETGAISASPKPKRAHRARAWGALSRETFADLAARRGHGVLARELGATPQMIAKWLEPNGEPPREVTQLLAKRVAEDGPEFRNMAAINRLMEVARSVSEAQATVLKQAASILVVS